MGFYALALAVAGFLVWIPYQLHVNHIALGGPVGLFFYAVLPSISLLILWAVVPRVDRFVPPGPRLDEDDVPRLFYVLREVAFATWQEMPTDVYLLNGVNAFVAHRGGVMGIGGRRVMGIGLPLLQSLTIQEFKAVIAHEFGHFHAGDVRVGPWVHKTRATIARTVAELSTDARSSSNVVDLVGNLLAVVFAAYYSLFLRVTHAVSRRQEFTADQVAALIAGSAVAISALRKTQGAAIAFVGYWRGAVAPVLMRGYRPPLVDGFARFVEIESVAARVAASVREKETGPAADRFDTHPSLSERIAAISLLPDTDEEDSRCAAELLGSAQRWEPLLLAFGNEQATPLTPLPWEQVVERIYLPQWEAYIENNGDVQGLSLRAPSFAGRLQPGTTLLNLADPLVRRIQTAGAALSVALLKSGWRSVKWPGDAFVFRCGALEVRPFVELMAVATGETTAERWQARCDELGIDLLFGESTPV